MNAKRALVVLALALHLVAGRVELGASSSTGAEAACKAARVNDTRYPGGNDLLGRLPWVRGGPRASGLVGLIWYWPQAWRERRLRGAPIFTGGTSPGGSSTKILWVFVGNTRGHGGPRLELRGKRLDADGGFTQTYGAISYSGQRGPSYASIVDVPAAGCWKLYLSTGTLRSSIVFQAVRAPESPTLCTADEVGFLVERFVSALNAGNETQLDAIFAREPEFEWYSTGAPGERLDPIARDRPSLVPYFRDRHAAGERLALRSVTFNGNTTGGRTYGNFVYELDRSAADLPQTPYRGKGAALCYRTRPDTIFVWSMAPAIG